MDKKFTSRDGHSIDIKLQRLSDDLRKAAKIERWATEEQYYNGVNSALWNLYEYLRTPYARRLKIRYQDRITPDQMNLLITSIINDIDDSYARVAETQSEFLRRINRLLSNARAVQGRITKANNVASSISRINEDDVYEIGDTFNDLTLINQDEQTEDSMTVHSDAGLMTLPVTQSENLEISSVTLMPNSNGVVVNEDENDIDKLYDDNADTWFEYEREPVDTSPLKLNLLVKLKTTKVINLIEIDPLVLDEKAFPRVLDIQTSLDGRTFRSIKEDLPANMTKNEEDAYFTLGPIGLRNQDIAQYIFTPRATQYIRIYLQQGKKVELDRGERQRIGITDIKVKAQSYKDQGNFVSQVFTLPFQSRRLFLEERVVDTEPLTGIDWQVSVDGGNEWFDIDPEETLEINTGSSGAVEALNEAASITVRASSQRLRDNFTGVARPLAEGTSQVVQRIQLGGLPSNIQLSTVPIQDSLDVFKLIYAVGQTYGLPLTTKTGVNDLTVTLPEAVTPLSETVKVNGFPYTRVASLATSRPDDRFYTIDYVNNEIKFGDSLTGTIPDGDITIELEPERVLLPDTSPFTVNLKYNHDFNESNTKVVWYDRARRSDSETLAKGTNEFQLENYPVLPSIEVTEDIPSATSSFYLQNVPVSGSVLSFTDKTTFATRVYTAPAAEGEYYVEELSSKHSINPVKVTVYSRTNNRTPGVVTLDAKAKIKQPQTSYTKDSWESAVGFSGLQGVVDIYEPSFSDTTVFNLEQTFIDGATELEQDGDYSIDYKNGKIYSFSDTEQTGNTSVKYTYQVQKNLNWEFNGQSDQLVINDDSFLVNKNDREDVVFNRNGQRSYIVFKDNRYIDIPLGTSSPYNANGVEITFDEADYIKGYTLPTGQTRVKLPNQLLIKNSVRFLFLSNDRNSFNDRIVTTASDGTVTVSPKPIKDIYGNSLEGTLVGEQTQRDVDKGSLTRERNFVDGTTELEEGGDYSIDYEKGILYTVTPIPEYAVIQYEYADVRVSYVATKKLDPEVDYDLDLTELTLDIFNTGGTAQDAAEILVKYEIIDQLKEDPEAVFNYYSPILMGYTIRARRQ